MRALDAATGATVWTATTGGQILDAAAVADGSVFVRARDGNAYAFDAATGAPRWTTPIGGNPAFGLGPTTTGPAVDAGRVHVTLGGRYLRALDPATGATIWSVEGSQLAPVSSTAPTIANGVLSHGAQTGTLVARNPATGAVLWSDAIAPHTTTATTAVVVANGAVYSSRSTGITAHHP